MAIIGQLSGPGSAARLIELSIAAPDAGCFRREVLGVLREAVGFRCALFLGLGAERAAPELTVTGLGPAYAERFARHLGAVSREIAPVKARAAGAQGIAVDTDVLGASVRRCLYYRELVAPEGGGHSLLCFLELRGVPLGMLMLGRELARPFRGRDLEQLRQLRPLLTLGLAAFGEPPRSSERCRFEPPARLTRREREIAELICRGYTNREIGCALGTSANTVRNQLAALFEKLGATTRAEAVALLLRG